MVVAVDVTAFQTPKVLFSWLDLEIFIVYTRISGCYSLRFSVLWGSGNVSPDVPRCSLSSFCYHFYTWVQALTKLRFRPSWWAEGVPLILSCLIKSSKCRYQTLSRCRSHPLLRDRKGFLPLSFPFLAVLISSLAPLFSVFPIQDWCYNSFPLFLVSPSLSLIGGSSPEKLPFFDPLSPCASALSQDPHLDRWVCGADLQRQ